MFEFDSFNQVEMSELYTKLEFPIQHFRFILTSYYQVESEDFRSIRLESLYRDSLLEYSIYYGFLENMCRCGLSL